MDKLDLDDDGMNMDSVNLDMGDMDVNLDEDLVLNIKSEVEMEEEAKETGRENDDKPCKDQSEPRQQDQVKVKEQEVEPESDEEPLAEGAESSREDQQDTGHDKSDQGEEQDAECSKINVGTKVKEEDFTKKAREEEQNKEAEVSSSKNKDLKWSKTLTTTASTSATTTKPSPTISLLKPSSSPQNETQEVTSMPQQNSSPKSPRSSWEVDHDYAFVPPKISNVESVPTPKVRPNQGRIFAISEHDYHAIFTHHGDIDFEQNLNTTNKQDQAITKQDPSPAIKKKLRPAKDSPVVVLDKCENAEDKIGDIQPRNKAHLYRMVLTVCGGDKVKAKRMMGNLCSRHCKVVSCPKPYPINARFHRIPAKAFRSPEMVDRWIRACGRQPSEFPNMNSRLNLRICHRHFGPEDYDAYQVNRGLPPHQQTWHLKADALPNRNLSEDPADERRRERIRQRIERKERKEIVQDLLEEDGAKVGKLKPKMGNVTDLEVKLDTATERILELEKEVKNLLNRNELHLSKIDELQLALKSTRKVKESNQRMLYMARRRWNNREKILRVTEKKKLAYAKEFMYKHTCWSRRMIDMFLDNKTATNWGPADLQLGLSIYSLSPRTYRFLLNFNLLPLPKKSTLRKAKVFKRVGSSETGTQLYQRTEPEQQQPTEGEEQVNDIASDDEDEETERRMTEEMAEADRESSADEEEGEDEENNEDDEVELLDSSMDVDKSTLDKPDAPDSSTAENQDFLDSLMEEVILPDRGKSMPNL